MIKRISLPALVAISILSACSDSKDKSDASKSDASKNGVAEPVNSSGPESDPVAVVSGQSANWFAGSRMTILLTEPLGAYGSETYSILGRAYRVKNGQMEALAADEERTAKSTGDTECVITVASLREEQIVDYPAGTSFDLFRIGESHKSASHNGVTTDARYTWLFYQALSTFGGAALKPFAVDCAGESVTENDIRLSLSKVYGVPVAIYFKDGN